MCVYRITTYADGAIIVIFHEVPDCNYPLSRVIQVLAITATRNHIHARTVTAITLVVIEHKHTRVNSTLSRRLK